MSKRVVVLDGRLALHMLPRSLRTQVEMNRWTQQLNASLSEVTAWLGSEPEARKLLGSLAVMLAYTKQVEVIAANEPALLAFKAWFEDTPAVWVEWVLAYTEMASVIVDAWGEAFTAGLQVWEITPERKPPDLMTPEEVADAADPKATSGDGAGLGSKRKSHKPIAVSPSPTPS